MRRHLLFVASLLIVSLTIATHAQTTTWRPVVLSDNGMVASGHALASEAGLRVLRSGGNAMDAALAAWAVQGLVEPEMTGLGGDMFILVYLAKTGEVKFINGTGFAPMAATVEFYKGKGGMPDEGPLSVSVPGAVGAVELAARTYGTRPLSEIFAPAAELAERGFPVSEALAGALQKQPRQSSSRPRHERSGSTASAARDGRACRPERSRRDAARDRREGQPGVLQGADRAEDRPPT